MNNITDFPETIWLVPEEDATTVHWSSTMWCQDRITNNDVKYIRADLVKELHNENILVV